MSLLTVAQRVADEVGLPRPAAVAASTDQLARQMFSLANTTLEELGKMNWPELDALHTFNTVVAQESYPAPDDYARYATDAGFIASQYYQMRGSLTANEWRRRANGFPSSAGRYRYRMFGYPLRMHVVPVPQTVENIAIEYISRNLVIGQDLTRKTRYVLDTDSSVMPEELVRKGLKWRIKHAKGLDYSEDFNSYETSKAELLAQRLNLGSIPVATRWLGDDGLVGPYIPDTGYGV